MNKINKKGFTLQELLVTIILLSIIVLIAIPSIMAINKRINLRTYEVKKNLILSAAEMYAQDEKPTPSNVLISTLLEKEYLKPDEINTVNCPSTNTYGCMINPVSKSSLNTINITVTVQGKTYVATVTNWP